MIHAAVGAWHMKVLFDHGTPAPLRHELIGHDVCTAFEMGWAALSNGELLREAERAFDVLVTTDQNLQHQQNLGRRRLAVLVLSTTSWPRIRRQAQRVLGALSTLQPGSILQLSFDE